MKEKDLESPTGLMTTPSTSTPHTKQTDQICLGSRPQKICLGSRLQARWLQDHDFFFNYLYVENLSCFLQSRNKLRRLILNQLYRTYFPLPISLRGYGT